MNRIAASFNLWRLNRWRKFRRAKSANEIALRKAWLSPAKAMSILEYLLNGQLGGVGMLTISGGKISTGMDQAGLILILKSMVDLLPTQTEKEQVRIRERIESLREHNWGYVRRAAAEAISSL